MRRFCRGRRETDLTKEKPVRATSVACPGSSRPLASRGSGRTAASLLACLACPRRSRAPFSLLKRGGTRSDCRLPTRRALCPGLFVGRSPEALRSSVSEDFASVSSESVQSFSTCSLPRLDRSLSVCGLSLRAPESYQSETVSGRFSPCNANKVRANFRPGTKAQKKGA